MRLLQRLLRRSRPAPRDADRLLRVYRNTSAEVEPLIRGDRAARPKRAA
jgi:hypothetical protein